MILKECTREKSTFVVGKLVVVVADDIVVVVGMHLSTVCMRLVVGMAAAVVEDRGCSEVDWDMVVYMHFHTAAAINVHISNHKYHKQRQTSAHTIK